MAQITGEQLRAWRAGRGISQAAFAVRVGVHPITVSKWERDVYGVPEGIARLVRMRPEADHVASQLAQRMLAYGNPHRISDALRWLEETNAGAGFETPTYDAGGRLIAPRPDFAETGILDFVGTIPTQAGVHLAEGEMRDVIVTAILGALSDDDAYAPYQLISTSDHKGAAAN